MRWIALPWPRASSGAALGEMPCDQILQRGADQQRFLLQAQFAAGVGAVVWVEHPVQRVGGDQMTRGGGVIAAAERGEVDRILGAGLPLAQGRHAFAVMRGHDEIVGAREHAFGRLPAAAADAVGFDLSAEADDVFDVRTFDVPQRAVAQPVVGALDLATVLGALREHAVAVAQAVAERGQAGFGEGIEEAGGEPAETAVAQRGVGLGFQNVGQRQPARGQFALQFGLQTQCRQCVAQGASHQEFHRQVMHAAAGQRPAGVFGLSRGPAFGQRVATDIRRRAQGRARGRHGLALVPGPRQRGAERRQQVGGGAVGRGPHRGGSCGCGVVSVHA